MARWKEAILPKENLYPNSTIAAILRQLLATNLQQIKSIESPGKRLESLISC